MQSDPLPMYVCIDVHSLTPTGASSSLGPGEDSSLCGTPTMLPQQEIVPYTAGPYTGIYHTQFKDTPEDTEYLH